MDGRYNYDMSLARRSDEHELEREMPIVYESRDYVIESCRFDGESRQKYAVDRKHHHVDHNGRQAVGLHNLRWTDSLEEAMDVMQADMALTA